MKINEEIYILSHRGIISRIPDTSIYYIKFTPNHTAECQKLNEELIKLCGKGIYALANKSQPSRVVISFPAFASLSELEKFILFLNDSYLKAKSKINETKIQCNKLTLSGKSITQLNQEEFNYFEHEDKISNIIQSIVDEPIKNNNNNEIRLQKQKASTRRGVVPKGRRIVGKKDKIAIRVGHLSYRICDF